MSTRVTYDGVEITPTPFVSRSFAPIDYGHRWGHVQSIKIDGFLTGASGQNRISDIGNIFKKSFANLVIESDEDYSFFVASNCILESVTIGSNKLPSDLAYAVPYAVNLKSYAVPSGVVDVSDDFSYSDNMDGTVSVQRKISAKGLQTNLSAIDNAYSFVSNFTGVNPLTVASPVFVNGATQSVLISTDESIDRLGAVYSVTENWKYETGSSNNYFTISTLNSEQSSDAEYVTLKLHTSFNGPVAGDISTLRQGATSYNYYEKLSQYGISTGNCVLNSFSVQEENGSNKIDFSADFTSGDLDEINGVWKHNVTVDIDEITEIKTYSIASSLKIIGSKLRMKSVIDNKKAEIVTGYNHYLGFMYNSLNDSVMYQQFKTSTRPLNPLPRDLSIKEDKTNQSLEITASFDDSDFIQTSTVSLPNGKSYPISAGKLGFTVSVDSSNWIFDIQKASNIEGHSIVQDLQCKTRDRVAISTQVEHLRGSLSNGSDVNSALSYNEMVSLMKGIVSEISGYSLPYMDGSDIKSGTFSHSASQNLILKDPIDPTLSVNKFYGFNANSYNTRKAGNKFGY